LKTQLLYYETYWNSQKGLRGSESDDDNDDNDNHELTHHELLQASLMLRKHVATLNNPFACKLKVMLGLFGQQTHTAGMQGMMNTKVTDYFVHTS
jgi:hypothetical protein